MPSSDGRATHHVPRAGAIRPWRGTAIRGALLAALLGAAPLLATPALAQDDPAVQRGVPAEATAANAVLAKERAIANAQRIAYQRYAAAVGRDPNASAGQIESLVTSMVVEGERSTLNGYSGRYTIRFRGAGSSGGNLAGSSSGGGSSGGSSGSTVPPLSGPSQPSGQMASQPAGPFSGPSSASSASSYLEAAAQFGSLNEWLALRRRLLSQPSVGSVDILAISTEGARLRIGLRAPAAMAAQELAGGGIVLAPAQPSAAGGPPASSNGPGWRVGLAGGA